jgi:hypothetical protein
VYNVRDMSDVDFGEKFSSNSFVQSDFEPRGLVGLLIKWGIAKDNKTAEIILLIMAVLFFGISIYITVNFLLPQDQTGSYNKTNSLNPLQERIEQRRLGGGNNN